MPGRARIQYLTNITTILVLPCVGLRHKPGIGGAWAGQWPHYSAQHWDASGLLTLCSVYALRLSSLATILGPNAAGPGWPHQGCLGSSHIRQFLPTEFGQSLWQGLLVREIKSASLLLVLKAVQYACEKWPGWNLIAGDLLNSSLSSQLYNFVEMMQGRVLRVKEGAGS